MGTNEKNSKSGAGWKEVTIGGVSGILLGSVGALFATGMYAAGKNFIAGLNNSDNNDSNNEEAPADANSLGSVASSVDDSMSFEEAFNAARAEVGADGYFVWHGNVYATCNSDEWNDMPAEQQEQYAAGTTVNYHVTNNNTRTEDNDEPKQEPANEDPADKHTEQEEQDEFEILGVETVVSEDGSEVNIGVASYNGQAVYYIDVDGKDDEFEYIASDLNGNNKLDDNEYIDISQDHVHVSDFQQIAAANAADSNSRVEEYYANNENLPDYENDADTGELA